MRNLLALLGFMIVLFLGVGYARGWYSFDFTTDSSGKVKVTGDIDTHKIKDDGSEFKDKAGHVIEGFNNKNGSGGQPPATLPVAKP